MHKYPSGNRALSSGKSPTDHRKPRATGGTAEPGEQLDFRLSPWLTVLLPGSGGWNLEVHAAIVVGFVRGRQIEVGKQDFVGAAGGEVKERIAHDGVVQHVGLVSV